MGLKKKQKIGFNGQRSSSVIITDVVGETLELLDPAGVRQNKPWHQPTVCRRVPFLAAVAHRGGNRTSGGDRDNMEEDKFKDCI